MSKELKIILGVIVALLVILIGIEIFRLGMDVGSKKDSKLSSSETRDDKSGVDSWNANGNDISGDSSSSEDTKSGDTDADSVDDKDNDDKDSDDKDSDDGKKSSNEIVTTDQLIPEKFELKSGDLTAKFVPTTAWGGNGNPVSSQYAVTITNNGDKDLTDWKIELDVKKGTKMKQIWNARCEIKDGKAIITPESYNNILYAKTPTDFGFIIDTKEKSEISSGKISTK